MSFLSDSDGGNNRFLLRYCLDENRMRRGAGGFFRRGDFRGCLRFGNCLKRKRKPDGSMGYFLGYSRFFSEKYDISLSGNTGIFLLLAHFVVFTLLATGAVASGRLGSRCPKEAYLTRRILKSRIRKKLRERGTSDC